MLIFQWASSIDQKQLEFVKLPKVAILSFSLLVTIHRLPEKQS